MIQLDAYGQRYHNDWIQTNTSDDYLSMDSKNASNQNQNNVSYSSTSSDVSLRLRHTVLLFKLILIYIKFNVILKIVKF